MDYEEYDLFDVIKPEEADDSTDPFVLLAQREEETGVPIYFQQSTSRTSNSR